jgi:hypothetical protein
MKKKKKTETTLAFLKRNHPANKKPKKKNYLVVLPNIRINTDGFEKGTPKFSLPNFYYNAQKSKRKKIKQK